MYKIPRYQEGQTLPLVQSGSIEWWKKNEFEIEIEIEIEIKIEGNAQQLDWTSISTFLFSKFRYLFKF